MIQNVSKLLNKHCVQLTCIIALSTSVSACNGSFREVVGLNKKAPDEFMVSSNPSLVVPPSFHLPTPVSNSNKQSTSAIRAARNALVNKPDVKNASAKGVELSILNKVDSKNNQSNIRQLINQENQKISAERREDKESFLGSLNPFDSEDEIINPDQEVANMRETIINGKPKLHSTESIIAIK